VVHADHTITMQAEKVGMIRGSGPLVCGAIHVVDIGIPADVLRDTCQQTEVSHADILDLLPRRLSHSSKFDYGRVAVIGGTLGMRGAPSLAAEAAISLGAGIVDLVSPAIHPLTPREIITHHVAHHSDGTISVNAHDEILEVLSRATAVAVGPGIGSNPATLEMIAHCIASLDPDVPVIIDADALRAASSILPRNNTIITPHMGEFSRILNQPRRELESLFVEHAQLYARNNGCIVHLKNVPSVTTTGSQTTYLRRGTPAMATAGSGDVLTGIIAAFVAQGCSPYDAARLGAYVHACAGEEIQKTTGYRSVLAHELIGAARAVVSSTLT
jgi:NAD(P)H-hydrate epimerase